MDWLREISKAIDKKGLFHDADHRLRFWEMVSCYRDRDFFNAGMCKCIFLGAWDDEHFAQLLSMLSQLSLSDNMDLNDMSENGRFMADEVDEGDKYILLLSCSFIENKPFDTKLPEDIDERTRLVIGSALEAAKIIDEMYKG